MVFICLFRFPSITRFDCFFFLVSWYGFFCFIFPENRRRNIFLNFITIESPLIEVTKSAKTFPDLFQEHLRTFCARFTVLLDILRPIFLSAAVIIMFQANWSYMFLLINFCMVSILIYQEVKKVTKSTVFLIWKNEILVTKKPLSTKKGDTSIFKHVRWAIFDIC